MAVREPGGLGYKVFAVLGVLSFLVVVAVLIRSYDTSSDVAAVAPPVTSDPNASVATATNSAPVGAVATGGGGMAGDGAGVAFPVVVAGLVTLTMVTAGGMVLRRREA